MKKHLVLKASILLIVMFFHSFVLVPKAHATTWEGIAGRLAFRAMAPSAIAALGSGTALVVGAVVAGGVGYLIYKSGAVDALQAWLTSELAGGAPTYPISAGNVSVTYGDGSVYYVVYAWGTSPNCVYMIDKPLGNHLLFNGGNSIYGTSYYVDLYLSAMAGAHGGYQADAAPTVPTDYSAPMGSSQPSFPSGSMYGTPGVAAAILGAAAILSAVSMSDGDAERFIAGSGATPIANDGVQEGSPPSTTDNTVTAGDTASIGLLQQIVNYVSNLVGIKTSIDGVKTSTDNLVSGVSTMTTAVTAQSGKLDNIASISSAQSAKLDNIAVGISNQTTALENVETKIEHLDNTISISTATSGSVSSRIDALKDAASTKFPFSLASSISVSAISGTSTYAFADLPLTASISIPIAPMAGPLQSLFEWIRQLLVWFFWAGTLLAILRKGMSM